VKIIKVKKCLKCPFFHDCFSFQCGFNGRKINNPYENDIPDWCPLDNWEKEI